MNSSVSKYWFLEGFGFDSLFFLRNVVFAGLSSQSHPSGAARTSSEFHLQRNSGKIGKDNDNNYTDFIIVVVNNNNNDSNNKSMNIHDKFPQASRIHHLLSLNQQITRGWRGFTWPLGS